MNVKRIVDTGFWTDDKVIEMFSPEDKLFFLYLMTNPHTTQLGIYPINRKIMAFELGYTTDTVSVLLDRFENKYMLIRFSSRTNEVAIKNYLRHSIIKGGKPVEDCLLKEISAVKDKSLLRFVYENLNKRDDLNSTVKKVISTLNENDNDNENDNEVSYHDTCHDTSTVHEEKNNLPVRHRYGEYENVVLSDADLVKLQSEFPKDWEMRIERLSSYIAQSGKIYKNHLATIRNWARKDEEQSRAKTGKNANVFLEMLEDERNG